MSTWLARLLITGGALALLWGAWRWDRAVQFEAGRQQVLEQARQAAEKKRVENEVLGKAREQAAAQGEFKHLERMQAQEIRDAQESSRRADLQRVVDRLRATRVAGDRGAPTNTGAAGGACEERRDPRIDALLAEGQRLAIEGAELLAEGGSLVGEGAGGLARGASLIELANDWGRAVKLGERP